MAQSAFDITKTDAKESISFKKPIIKHQAVTFRPTDIATDIEASRLLYQNATKLYESRNSCIKESSMAKLFASEMTKKVCSKAFQILSAYSYMEDYSLERIYRDVRVC